MWATAGNCYPKLQLNLPSPEKERWVRGHSHHLPFQLRYMSLSTWGSHLGFEYWGVGCCGNCLTISTTETALAEHTNIFILWAVISEKQRGSQKLVKSRAGPDAGEGATQERRGSDREAVLLFSLPLPASSPFPTLGSQTQSQGLIRLWICCIWPREWFYWEDFTSNSTCPDYFRLEDLPYGAHLLPQELRNNCFL